MRILWIKTTDQSLPLFTLLSILSLSLTHAIEERSNTPFKCYTCTYTTSSDPSVDYECATKPWNVTKGLPYVDCGNYQTCVTRTVYTKDRTKIMSVYRGCGFGDTYDCGMRCCVEDSIYDYTCQDTCRDIDYCNNADESSRLVRNNLIDSSGTGDHNSGNTISAIFTDYFSIAKLTFLSSLQFILLLT